MDILIPSTVLAVMGASWPVHLLWAWLRRKYGTG